MDSIEFVEWIKEQNKIESLQTYTNCVCQAQKVNCINNVFNSNIIDEESGYGLYDVIMEDILKAKQPNLEELCQHL